MVGREGQPLMVPSASMPSVLCPALQPNQWPSPRSVLRRVCDLFAAEGLQSDNQRLRSKAIKTLADIGDRDARERLENAAKESDKENEKTIQEQR